MGFWSSTKVLVSSSTKALANGIELAAEGAKYLEKETDYSLTKFNISTLLSLKKTVGDDWYSGKYDESRKRLVDHYREIIEKFPDRDLSNNISDLEKIEKEAKLFYVNRDRKNIEAYINKINERQYKLPIVKIELLRDAINEVDKIEKSYFDLCMEDEVEWSLSTKKDLQNKIIELEALREEQFFDYYDDGYLKRSWRKKDGNLHGLYEELFHRGGASYQFNFDAGSLEKGVMYDGSGSILAKVVRQGSYYNLNIFIEDFSFDLMFPIGGSGSKCKASLNFSNSNHCISVEGNKSMFFSKGKIYYKIIMKLFSFDGIALILYLYRDKNRNETMDKVNSVNDICNVFIEKIESVCTGI